MPALRAVETETRRCDPCRILPASLVVVRCVTGNCRTVAEGFTRALGHSLQEWRDAGRDMQQAYFMFTWVSAVLDGRYALAMEFHRKAAKLTERLNNTGVLAAYSVPGVAMMPIDNLEDAASMLQPRLQLKQFLADRRCAEKPLPGKLEGCIPCLRHTGLVVVPFFALQSVSVSAHIV